MQTAEMSVATLSSAGTPDRPLRQSPLARRSVRTALSQPTSPQTGWLDADLWDHPRPTRMFGPPALTTTPTCLSPYEVASGPNITLSGAIARGLLISVHSPALLPRSDAALAATLRDDGNPPHSRTVYSNADSMARVGTHRSGKQHGGGTARRLRLGLFAGCPNRPTTANSPLRTPSPAPRSDARRSTVRCG